MTEQEILAAIWEETKRLYDEGSGMDDRTGDGMMLASENVRGVPGFRDWWKKYRAEKEQPAK